jgi:hypothetical protein
MLIKSSELMKKLNNNISYIFKDEKKNSGHKGRTDSLLHIIMDSSFDAWDRKTENHFYSGLFLFWQHHFFSCALFHKN